MATEPMGPDGRRQWQRHKLEVRGAGVQWVCSCGLTDRPSLVVLHVRQARRWNYMGRQVTAGDTYYMWKNKLTGELYAWWAPIYRDEMLRKGSR